MSTLISRDPFAREELHRERVYTDDEADTCTWCGSVHSTPKGHTFLFRYSVESDGGRKWKDRRLFCSVDCRRTFYS